MTAALLFAAAAMVAFLCAALFEAKGSAQASQRFDLVALVSLIVSALCALFTLLSPA